MESREQELTDILGSENPGDWTLPSFIFFCDDKYMGKFQVLNPLLIMF